MTDRRRTIRSTTIVSGLFAGLLTGLAVTYALPALSLHQPSLHQPSLHQPLANVEADIGESAGGSVHAKNSATPGWMLDLQARNAFERPVTHYGDKPGFWI